MRSTHHSGHEEVVAGMRRMGNATGEKAARCMSGGSSISNTTLGSVKTWLLGFSGRISRMIGETYHKREEAQSSTGAEDHGGASKGT